MLCEAQANAEVWACSNHLASNLQGAVWSTMSC